jgi:LysM repeat protein
MNSLKGLFFVTVLAAVACGVYVSLNRRPEAPPPPGAPKEVSGPPTVSLPPLGAVTGQPSSSTAGTGAAGSGGLAPSFPAFPPAVPGVPAGNNAATAGSTAPPYTPPGGPLSTAGAGGGMARPFGATASSGGAAPPFGASRDAAPPFSPSRPPTASADKAGPVLPYTSSNPISDRADTAALARQSPPPAAERNSPASKQDSGFRAKFESMMKSISTSMDEGRLGEAHLTLSQLYGSPEVPPEQARDITRMLDQMAATVIYSRQHFLEPPYRVQPGDTLEKIADSYSVPWQLLARINGIRDGQNLQPGRELKVVRGPFNALVDLDKFELTLMLKGRYAGRFPIGVGADQPKLDRTYVVRDKKSLVPADGRAGAMPANDPNYPLGKYWIDLGNQVGIHGTNNPQGIGKADNRGTICLGDQDIEDVFGILSVGSQVVIRR